MPSTERLVDIVTPLGEALWFRQMTGTEALSIPFEYDVVLHASEKTPSLSAKAMLGKDVTLKVETEKSAGIRPFNGICTRFGNAGREGVHIVYTAKLRPWLWLASRRSDCRIFQKLTVPEIIDQVLQPYGYPWTKKLNRSYRTWEYCVQYQETDMNFVMRLMEHEGIYFHFEHAIGSHTLVLIDDVTRHSLLAGRSDIRYVGKDASTVSREEHFNSWSVREEVDPGEYISIDYDFEHPKADLKINSQHALGYSHSDHERYVWPGGYTRHGEGEDYAKVGIQTLQSEQERCQGHTTVRTMAPGYLFKLNNCPRKEQNRQYLSVAATYFFRDNARMSEGSGEGDSDWGITVTSQPTTIPYRPQLLTPKPRTLGPQTAVVVGPAGEEIHTDKYGRVRVQFHWDRDGKKNEKSSCFIRVGTPLAGGKWGMIQIPRIGQEVIVDFLCGDPDYPIIIGSVYNEAQPVPYELDKYKAIATWKSHSTPNGTTKDFNELRFDDRFGKEQVFIHAQRRMDVRVKKNKYETVQGSSGTSIWGGHQLTVGGALDLHVKGDAFAKVDGKADIGVCGDLQVDVGGSAKLHVSQDLQQNALSILLEGKTSVTLKSGGSFVKVGPEGVTIQGPLIRINCGGGAPGATSITLEDPLDAGGADTGEPGYLDNLPHGGGGGGGGRHKRTVGPERARTITRNSDGSVNYGGSGLRISGSQAHIDKTIATLDKLDGTQTGNQLINNLQSNGHTTSIVENNAQAQAGGGGLTTSKTANGFPAGTNVNLGSSSAPNVQTSDGSGSDSEVNWQPGAGPKVKDENNVEHTMTDEALLGHELIHADHNGRGQNLGANPDPKDNTGNQEESRTIGINDHASEAVSERNLQRDLGEDWHRTDHDGHAHSGN